MDKASILITLEFSDTLQIISGPLLLSYIWLFEKLNIFVYLAKKQKTKKVHLSSLIIYHDPISSWTCHISILLLSMIKIWTLNNVSLLVIT